ncbi:MAG: hypothetical protein K6T61_04285 [Bryobacteraceae bacterium]|nr:hypothetical protein [Bryobacteraceae bacterium]
MKKSALFVALALSLAAVSSAVLYSAAQAPAAVEMTVDFAQPIRVWDGFGVNYVQVAQTRDYKKWPEEYGGFSTLNETQRRQILDMIFGEDGLKPGILKMFLDPYHEGLTEADNDNNDPNVINPSRFDHKTTTEWMRYFAREGLARTRARGADLQIITTLYGPQPWATKQKFVRGRDLDPRMKEEVAEYMIAWVKFLREEEKLPVRYISLHNEGDEIWRWPADGSTAGTENHDFNMYWPSSQIVDFLRFMRPMLDRQDLKDVGITPGECSTWRNMAVAGIAWAIQNDPVALRNLGLLTSHGFGLGRDNVGINAEFLRVQRPELKTWTTSMSWGKMDVTFIEAIRQQIYLAHVNGVIPWAAVQTDTWIGGDPNPGTAFRVDRKGGFTVEPGYYLYKQVSRAGQPGMAVATVSPPSNNIGLIAFASNGTRHPDALVAFNTSSSLAKARIRVSGTKAAGFTAFATSDQLRYQPAGTVPVKGGAVEIDIPAGGVVTLFGAQPR